MDKHYVLAQYIGNKPHKTGKVVDYDVTADKLLRLDLTAANTELTLADVADTARFSAWLDDKLKVGDYRYAIGGYMEHRTIYGRSALFDTADEPRRLHLGVDIWGTAGTPVYTPFDGTVHSFQDNNNFGDYGPTIILQHSLDGLTLYSLYGHLNRQSLAGLHIGMPVTANQQIALFGNANENGSWPAHLHFQLMFNMEGKTGDYPGVCRYSEMEKYRANVPDPEIILRFG